MKIKYGAAVSFYGIFTNPMDYNKINQIIPIMQAYFDNVHLYPRVFYHKSRNNG